MTSQETVLELFAQDNPIPNIEELDLGDLGSPAYLEALEQRSSGMTDLDTMKQTSSSERSTRSPWLVAAIVAVLIGAVVLLIAQRDDAPVFGPDEAVNNSNELIESWSAPGDVEAVMTMLTEDVAVSEIYTGMTEGFEELEPDFFEQYVVWTVAQGAVLTEPTCTAMGPGTGDAELVECRLGWQNAVEAAADASPVPTVITLTVTPDGFTSLAFEYVPAFGSDSFDTWLVTNYPNDRRGVEWGDWSSIEEAEQGGILRAQYALEWAAESGANG